MCRERGAAKRQWQAHVCIRWPPVAAEVSWRRGASLWCLRREAERLGERKGWVSLLTVEPLCSEFKHAKVAHRSGQAAAANSIRRLEKRHTDPMLLQPQRAR